MIKDIKANRKKETAFQFVQEIKKILTYTNATPFKSKANRVFCMYCPLDSPHFEDPDELRSHTRNQHIYERTNKIEYTMRPLWLNEILKLDIHNLICTVCCLPISGWNEMFKHLKTQHSASFTHAFTKAIPYTLTSENECALCKTQFPNFLLVDTHMNGHYNNYVCADCGDTFICEYRLKQHIKIHEAKHHCSYCNKTFILEKHKRSHEDTVHEKIPKFKCHYCDEKFSGDLSRHMHTLEKHEEKVTPLTCEICGKSFTWKAYYTNHMRKIHGEVSYKNGQAYQCEFCGQEFTTEAVLKKHNLKHVSAEETKYACSICNKLYGTRKSLRVHIKNLHPDHGDSESNSQDSYNFVIKS